MHAPTAPAQYPCPDTAHCEVLLPPVYHINTMLKIAESGRSSSITCDPVYACAHLHMFASVVEIR